MGIPRTSQLPDSLFNQTLTLNDLAELFGCNPQELENCTKDLIADCDFRYRSVSTAERDQLILKILQALDDAGLKVAGKSRQPIWESGWSENETAFASSGYDRSCLIPRYFQPGRPIRLQREYAVPYDGKFEVNFIRVLRRFLAAHYLADVSTVYEFGCGTGYHLIDLAEQFPTMTIHGLDWTAASQRILGQIASHYGLNLKTGRFDFFSPPDHLHLEPDSGVITLAALEQIGDRHGPFIDFLLRHKPKVCIHLECIHEVYDETNLPDYLALRYHRKRGYLSGYLTRLRSLERQGYLTINKVQRTFLGDTYHEAYTIIIWSPL